MTTPSIPELHLAAVTKSFTPTSPPVLDSINLTLTRGEFVSVIGPSGCGKSTLLKLVAGLESLTSGEILVHGVPPAAARETTSFVFQDATLLPWRTVARNISLALELEGRPANVIDQTTTRLLDLVGLTHVAQHYPRQLSGGQKMRVSIARALATRPRLLLMDEPFAALDEITRDRMNEELLRLRDEGNWTVLFVTHSVAEAVFLSSRIVLLAPHPGRIAHILPIDLPYPRTAALRESPPTTPSSTKPPASSATPTTNSPSPNSETQTPPRSQRRHRPRHPPHPLADEHLRPPRPPLHAPQPSRRRPRHHHPPPRPRHLLPHLRRSRRPRPPRRHRSRPPHRPRLRQIPLPPPHAPALHDPPPDRPHRRHRPAHPHVGRPGPLRRSPHHLHHLSRPLIANATQGLISVDPNLVQLFQMHNATQSQILRKLRLPHALPYLFTGMRISSGIAVIGAITGELFAGSTRVGQGGLGYSILYAMAQLQTDYLFALVLAATLLGFLFFFTVTFFEWLFLHKWHTTATPT